VGRREIFAGNWKMYKTRDEAVELAKGILAGLGNIGKREVILFPPAVHARELCVLCAGSPVKTGFQNMYHEKEGAFTGEHSPAMVKDSGCAYVLIGHSERRHIFKETDSDINKKIEAALAHGIGPVVCVGELLEEREKGLTGDVIKRQIEGAFKNIGSGSMNEVIIAYEPVWAIGTGKVATPELAEDVHRELRGLIGILYGSSVAEKIPLLYGGSVKPDNIAGLFAKDNIDGVLVGGACLKADSFLNIIHVK